ncbi:1-acyl-sn-glycerol-3-phosphate acyltransferase [Paramuribaculum intestinale]|uniref:Acyltransferase n=1 Tax=Paramuribaculum intestinale TaxID=2094151 RepID=A0A2V1IYW1_9BACT|nr:1-acyl-sn-glycerol-3-phosphate acyltransferase [Paramuribaculum intestinale]PWB08195.1 acyltransferase [Paramuribaculum intestinale]PWB11692.1 acyltransferase [Paramuribaculum intestinale]RXE63327.1 acyltransferase [Muribaculaceae bacterium Isolate-004 (NCI)]WLT41198.1 1-acyl-sn-glycerol-3-phosphate acyltransferase [Paramuribaculum intestinale]
MTDDRLRIDLERVLRSRLGDRRMRWIPRRLIAWLERLICQREMNEVLDHAGHLRGAEFCHAALDHLSVSYTTTAEQRLPDTTRVIIASNHPLGGLDGITLIDWAARRYGCQPIVMVNDLLMAITPLAGVFLPINKHGAQSREASEAVDRAFASDRPVIMFPAGLCSRQLPGGTIADLRWRPTFVNRALRSGRTIVPVRFSGINSPSFYRFARLRQRSGLKLNIEMALLPREVFRHRGSHFEIRIGHPITPESIAGGRPQTIADQIRATVYTL